MGLIRNSVNIKYSSVANRNNVHTALFVVHIHKKQTSKHIAREVILEGIRMSGRWESYTGESSLPEKKAEKTYYEYTQNNRTGKTLR